MENVQNVTVINNGWYLGSFLVTNGEFQSSPTPDMWPLRGSQTINMAATTFGVGEALSVVLSPVLGSGVTAAEQVSLALNGRTAVYTASGDVAHAAIVLTRIEEPSGPAKTPPSWPSGIPVNNVPFANWDGTIAVAQIWTCAPRTAADAAAACNWAAANNYTVRPRGIMHNWSPLSLQSGLAVDPKILLIDSTKSLNAMSFMNDGALGPRVKVGAGATMGALLNYLQNTAGGPNLLCPGWSFPHIPAPDHLTVGGVLAINGHGTAIPNPLENWDVSYGSMSNRILELTAIVTDPTAKDPAAYAVKTFKRGDPDAKAFLTQLGRALVVDATLQVIPNYNLRCQSMMNLSWQTLFAPPNPDGSSPANSMGDFLNQTGRVEAIWFPFTDLPWLKVWSCSPTQPSGSRLVTGPNNYTFSDNLPEWITPLVKSIATDAPQLTPAFGKVMQDITIAGLLLTNTTDLWGPSKNTLFYVKDTTLRVTANGYAVRMKKGDVQKAVNLFANKYQSMLAAYDAKKQWPINSPLEIRITSLDTPQYIPTEKGVDPGRPVISSLSADSVSRQNGWDVALWLDVLTLPGTPFSNEFYEEMESWFFATFTGSFGQVMPEWSKGWAFTASDGAWSNPDAIEDFRESYTTDRDPDDTWAWEVATLAKYDASGLFQSPLTTDLFVDP